MPIVVARETSPVNMPDVAIDGARRTVLIWTDITGDFQRILAAVLSPTAVAGPTVVAQGRLIPLPVLPGRAAASAGQVLRIRRNGTVRTTLPSGGSTKDVATVTVRRRSS